MGTYYGIHSKPVQRSLELLDTIDAIEFVEGSSVGRSFTPFTVKLRKGFETITPDGNLFCCKPTKIHACAANVERVDKLKLAYDGKVVML